jgi:hypothetical protein
LIVVLNLYIGTGATKKEANHKRSLSFRHC